MRVVILLEKGDRSLHRRRYSKVGEAGRNHVCYPDGFSDVLLYPEPVLEHLISADGSRPFFLNHLEGG